MIRKGLQIALFLQLVAGGLYAESGLHKLFYGGVQTAAFGPQWYNRQRERHRVIDDVNLRTSKLHASMWGVHGEYDRIRRCSLYWSAEGGWAQGRARGKTVLNEQLRATATDWFVEGRLGWAFAPNVYARPLAILYSGVGYFKEDLDYHPPTPIPIKSDLTFTYIPLGLFVRTWLTCGFWIGFRGEAWFPVNDPVVRIFGDPDFGDYQITAGSKTHFRAELPIQWNFSGCWGLRVTPFFWQLRYGRREAFPTNFINTNTYIGGVRAEITTQW